MKSIPLDLNITQTMCLVSVVFSGDIQDVSRKYWAEGWSGLDVGHRGLGNSYTQVGNLYTQVRNSYTQVGNSYTQVGITIFKLKLVYIG